MVLAAINHLLFALCCNQSVDSSINPRYDSPDANCVFGTFFSARLPVPPLSAWNMSSERAERGEGLFNMQ